MALTAAVSVSNDSADDKADSVLHLRVTLVAKNGRSVTGLLAPTEN